MVATDDDKIDFDLILEKGQPRDKSASYYSRNYSYFLSCCDEYAKTHLNGWKEFCLFILERCIILPIECSDLDSALTIFGTLNNRGLPLADSDIFKAELYKTQPSKQTFATKVLIWVSFLLETFFVIGLIFQIHGSIDFINPSTSSSEGLSTS